MNDKEKLAARILCAMYANPKTEVEDCEHNVRVAVNAADTFLRHMPNVSPPTITET